MTIRAKLESGNVVEERVEAEDTSDVIEKDGPQAVGVTTGVAATDHQPVRA